MKFLPSNIDILTDQVFTFKPFSQYYSSAGLVDWWCGGLLGNNMDFVNSLQVPHYNILYILMRKHFSPQSLAGLGSEKDEGELSYQEKKALEKKRFGNVEAS